MFRAASYVGYKLCWPDDLVINSLWAWARGLGVSRHHGIISSAYGVYRLRSRQETSARFIHYLVRSLPFQWELQVRSKGIWISRLQLTDEEFLRAPFPLPAADEQDAIVHFLDWATGRLDQAIRVKRKLIALLNEQKQAIIHRAVTRGLDPNVPLRPSDLAWLGDIPRNWEVWQIGHLARIGNGSTPSRGSAVYWSENGYPWLNSASVNHSPITSANQFVTETALKECHLPRVPANSILIAITGQGKTRGTAAMLAFEATINQHIAYVSLHSDKVSPEFLCLFLKAAYGELRRVSDASGSTKGALTCADVTHFKVAVPEYREQLDIVSRIYNETRNIEEALDRHQREIDLLREYRTRLVADVATGKLDVRGLEIPQEETSETAELENSDELETDEDQLVEEYADAD
jgi:type I restriction enzyme S subunit